MTYAADLAKDRDTYLAQRNSMARSLRALVEVCEKVGGPLAVDPAIEQARKELAKIDNAPEGLALLRGKGRGDR